MPARPSLLTLFVSFLGIGLPLVPEVGLGVTAAILVLWTAYVLSTLRRKEAAPEPNVPAAPTRTGSPG